jgi:hypothetical protein
MKNYIILYHYSNKDFTGYIRPAFFGDNAYTDKSVKVSEIKRSYYYIDRTNKEYYFDRAKYCYIVKVNQARLYNIDLDNQGIIKRLKIGQDLYREVKKNDYQGIITYKGIQQAVLFKSVKIRRRELE